jgi:hypothetical protein
VLAAKVWRWQWAASNTDEDSDEGWPLLSLLLFNSVTLHFIIIIN